jgi:hypothetical protein
MRFRDSRMPRTLRGECGHTCIHIMDIQGTAFGADLS